MKIFLSPFICFALAITSISCDNNSNNNNNTSAPPAAPAGYEEGASTIELSGATAKQVILSNGLKVVLISSPTSKTAAAAVGARVGHRDNPRHLQGLAHFLEHMLFLGTKEFPVVGEYSQFLRSNSGYSNAYTSSDHTNYYLEIRADKFQEATHRLSRFFVTPLFDPSYVEREKSAVHNEFNMRLQAFKQSRPLSAFLKPNDPSRLFSIGNDVTLKNATAADTEKMFKEYYYAEAMHAVLAGPQSIETLESWAQQYFSDIPSKNKPLQSFDPFIKVDLSHLPAQVNFKSDGEERFLRLFIPVKNAKEENEKLLSSIGLLFGDESKNSLMYLLQTQGWLRPGANMLSGGASHAGISATLQLSEKGFNEYKQVINYIKGYLSFLQQTGLPTYVNQELDSLEATSALSEEYYEINADMIQNLNRKYFARDWMPENWHELFWGRTYPAVTPAVFTDYLNRIWYDKIWIQLTHPSFPTVNVDFNDHQNLNQGGLSLVNINGQKAVVDSIYSFASPVVSVDPSEIRSAGSFNLKEQNIYLPESFDVYPDESTEVFTPITGEWGEIRLNPTPNVNASKAYMSLNLYSSGVDLNEPKNTAALFLLREWMRNTTANSSYAMTVAGFELNYPIYVDRGSIGVEISGWSDTFLPVLRDTFSQMQFTISSSEFASLKGFYRQKIAEEQASEISPMGSRAALSMITPVYLDYADLYSALDQLSAEGFRQFVKDFFSAFYIQGSLTGNVKRDYIPQIIASIEDHWSPIWNLTPPTLNSPIFETNENGELVLLEKEISGPDSQNSLYLGYWNLGSRSDQAKEKWLAKIFGTWIYPDYYEELRTHRQLAYSLYAGYTELMKNNFLSAQLLSSTHSADQIQNEVDGFIKDWVTKELPQKTEALLQSTVDNFVVQAELPQAPKALHDLIQRFINEGYKDLNEVQSSLEILKSLTLQEVIDYGNLNFIQTPKRGAFVKVKKKE